MDPFYTLREYVPHPPSAIRHPPSPPPPSSCCSWSHLICILCSEANGALRGADTLHERWTVLFNQGMTLSPHSEFAWVSQELRKVLDKVEHDAVVLAETISVVQNDRARFAHIDDAELAARRGAVAEIQARVRALTADLARV